MTERIQNQLRDAAAVAGHATSSLHLMAAAEIDRLQALNASLQRQLLDEAERSSRESRASIRAFRTWVQGNLKSLDR